MHTSVGFSVEHFGISMVHGRFNSFEGIIDADPAHLDKSKVRFTIVTSSIDTNVKMRDDDLRSANFFDAAKYPAIVFQSTRIRKARAYDATSARYTAYGNLTMHGVTKEIAIPFVVRGPITDPHGNRRIGIMMNLNVRRLDFGIGGARKMATGVLAIGNDVNVNISLEAMPEKK